MANLGDSGKFGPAMRSVPNSLYKKKGLASVVPSSAKSMLSPKYKNKYSLGKVKKAASKIFGI